MAEFDELFRQAVSRVRRPEPTRLVVELAAVPGRAEQVRNLTERESDCCSFFTFTLTETGERLRLDVEVPAGQVAVLDALTQRAGRAGRGAA